MFDSLLIIIEQTDREDTSHELRFCVLCFQPVVVDFSCFSSGCSVPLFSSLSCLTCPSSIIFMMLLCPVYLETESILLLNCQLTPDTFCCLLCEKILQDDRRVSLSFVFSEVPLFFFSLVFSCEEKCRQHQKHVSLLPSCSPKKTKVR